LAISTVTKWRSQSDLPRSDPLKLLYPSELQWFVGQYVVMYI
jgi:hypothetical protein